MDKILLSHGEGGKRTRDLIAKVIARYFDNPVLAPFLDSGSITGIRDLDAATATRAGGVWKLVGTYADGKIRVAPEVVPPGDVFSSVNGTDKIAEKVTQPLKGLHVVCYYGCLLTRPPEVTEASHPENPTDLDELMQVLGLEVLDWSYKTSCCGAAHSLSRPDVVIKLAAT